MWNRSAFPNVRVYIDVETENCKAANFSLLIGPARHTRSSLIGPQFIHRHIPLSGHGTACSLTSLTHIILGELGREDIGRPIGGGGGKNLKT